MKMIPVDSSLLRRLGYDWQTQTLRLEFQSGTIYEYLEVPSEVVVELQTADSIGRYFNAEIKDAYNVIRVQ